MTTTTPAQAKLNVIAAWDTGVFILENAGFSVEGDAVTLVKTARNLHAGTSSFWDALTDANIDAAGRVLTVLAKAAQDPAARANLLAIPRG